MQYRNLGRTGLRISEIGFGAWGIGKSMWKGSQDEQSLRALRTAIDCGINFFDTALVYGNGHSEKLIGKAFRESRETLYVATKVPPRNYGWPARGSLSEAFPKAHITRSVEQSLKNLGLATLDLVQLHVWSPDWLAEDDWYEAFLHLKEAGKIRYFGVSINDHEPESAVELVRSGRVDTVQVIFNIFDQSPEDSLFPACAEQNVGVIVRVPFDEGALTGQINPETVFPKGDWRNRYFSGDRKHQVHKRIAALKPLLGEEASTLPELALRYCLHPETVSTVIPGMRSAKHVVANTAASRLPGLSRQMVEQLRGQRWVRNFYPSS